MFQTGISESLCECSDCSTAFCCAKTKHAKGFLCRHCKHSHETSVLFASEDSNNKNTTGIMDMHGVRDASAVLKKIRYSDNFQEYYKMDVDSIGLTNMDSNPHTNVEMNDFEEYADITETNYEDDIQSCVDSIHSGKQMSITTAAQLSAQIMNMPFKDFKESISREQIETYKVHDILKRLKEAYDACTCKICECIVGKPNHSQSCSCKPCDCKDCVSLRRVEVSDEIKYKSCNCEPCECIDCAKLDKPTESLPCDCEPCQCMVCKGMAIRKDKMVIVAPVRQGSQRANCLCAPCDCPRCRQRSLNLSLSHVHEMSTGINRHPNCHCEVCMDDSCQPNGAETCGCQIRRHGVIRKPVEKNPHDFDIRRTIVLNNPIKTHGENAKIRTISTYSALEKNKYSSYNRPKVTTSECNCSMCECIACDYKDNITNSKTFLDKSLRTLKVPCTDFKACNCSPCECINCISKKYEHCTESAQSKSCACEICDCLYCEGAPKPGNALSSIIPVSEMSSNKFEPVLEPTLDKCNDCWKLAPHSDVCHCDICRCMKFTDKGDVSEEESLYPIKKGELLTPSRMRTDPISELELPSQSSEYTQLKHSKGQSNVFKRESKASERTKPEFTVLHLVPRQRTKQLSLKKITPSKSDLVADKLDSSDNILRIDLPEEDTVTYMTQCYRASTSKTLSSHVIETTDSVGSYRKTKIGSAETACLYDSTRANKGRNYQNSPLSSASSSKHGFQNLTPSTSTSKTKASQRSLLKKKVNQVNGSSEVKKEASSKEVSFFTCTNGVQRGGALHDCYGRQALLHKTNVYTALSSSNLNVEKNSDVSEEPSFNQDDSENRFYCKLEHSCTHSLSDNTIDLQLLNNDIYKTALTTLEKSKTFSLELVKLLEQYETANSEFESISKKLKQSHDSVFNDFDLCSRTCRGINSKIKAIGFVSLVPNQNNKMPKTVDSSSLSLIKENSSTSPQKTPLKMKNPTDILLEIKPTTQAGKVSAEICEQSKQIDNRICPTTENYNSSTTGLIRLVDEELMVKNYRHRLRNQLIGIRKVKLFQFHAPLAGEDLASLIDTSKIMAKMKPEIQNKENVVDTFKGTSSYKEEASRVVSRVITNLEAAELETTKLKEEPGPKVYIIQNEEAFNPIQISSDIDRKSSSYCNTQALEKLPHGVKDLLKIPALPKASRNDFSSSVRHIRKAIKLKNDWRCANPLLVTPGGSNKEFNVKAMAKDATSTNSEKKVQFCSLRRVSDHSVLVKWETPSCVKDVEGYEILVDGRAAQKIFSPARCMAVVTCLPRSEPVLLTIRTLTNDQSNGLPSATITYRPRAKYIKI